MKIEFTLTWTKAIIIVCAAIFLALAVSWSGLVPISAASGHIAPYRWFLGWTMENAVNRQSMLVETPEHLDLTDPNLIRRAAGHFATECAVCHGAPGVAQSPVVDAMTPAPPRLEEEVHEWDDAALFWIVKHGLKYTGMPAWPTRERDDEVWAQVAFLRALPGMTEEEYRDLAFGETGGRDPLLHSPDVRDASFRQALADCARCHGTDGRGAAGDAFPVIAGQPEAYLYATLLAFADGERSSGFMAPPARRHDEGILRELAAYYAGQPRASFADVGGAASTASDSPGMTVHGPRAEHASNKSRARIQDAAGRLEGDGSTSGMPVPIPSTGGPPASAEGLVELGRRIATTGLPSRDIPACESCHSSTGPVDGARYPYLAGQPEWYVSEQLRLFRAGERGGTPYAGIMAEIADRMTDEQINALASWYAGGHSARTVHRRGADQQE